MSWQKRFSSVCAAVLILAMLCGCGKEAAVKNNSFDKKAEASYVDDIFVAQNESYKLELNSATMGITLTDLKTGAVFGTNPVASGEQQFDELGMPIKRHPQVESAVFIEYLDVKTNTTAQLISYNAAVKSGRTVIENIENGVKIKYYFDDAEIMVPLSYTLRDNGVAITLDPTEIQENDNMLINVSVAPFMCAVSNTEQNGYLVYPSGSGTLVYPKEISQQGESYEAEVYGQDCSKEVWDKVTTEKAIRLPIFGAKQGNNATLAVIEQGAESSLIKMTVGATSIGYTSAYVKYQVRGYTANIKELYNNRYYEGLVYAENLLTTPLTVAYYPLCGDKASYSGMAETYRAYLDKTFGESEAAASKLDLTFIGGAMTVKSFLGIPYSKLYPTTTLSQVSDILNELNENGVEVTNVNLSGFGENGIDSNKLAGNFKIDSSLGSAKELKALGELCSNIGTQLYFDFDTVTFNDSANGYSTYFDAATRANRKKAKDYTFDIAVLGRNTENAYSLLARDCFGDVAKKVLKASDKIGAEGIGLSTLSSMTYSDYTDKQSSEFYSKEGFASQVTKIISDYKKADKKILGVDANAFAAAASDCVTETPTVSSGAFAFDEDIPLYQMVFRGRTAISCESINLVSDSKKQLLRAVESGCGISYTLTASYDTVLLDSNSSVFYNSLYSDIKQSVIDEAEKLSEYYEKTGNSKIASHTVLSEGLRCTVFENGVAVYVNYTDSAIDSPAGTVEANSYLIGEGIA